MCRHIPWSLCLVSNRWILRLWILILVLTTSTSLKKSQVPKDSPWFWHLEDLVNQKSSKRRSQRFSYDLQLGRSGKWWLTAEVGEGEDWMQTWWNSFEKRVLILFQLSEVFIPIWVIWIYIRPKIMDFELALQHHFWFLINFSKDKSSWIGSQTNIHVNKWLEMGS